MTRTPRLSSFAVMLRCVACFSPVTGATHAHEQVAVCLLPGGVVGFTALGLDSEQALCWPLVSSGCSSPSMRCTPCSILARSPRGLLEGDFGLDAPCQVSLGAVYTGAALGSPTTGWSSVAQTGERRFGGGGRRGQTKMSRETFCGAATTTATLVVAPPPHGPNSARLICVTTFLPCTICATVFSLLVSMRDQYFTDSRNLHQFFFTLFAHDFWEGFPLPLVKWDLYQS